MVTMYIATRQSETGSQDHKNSKLDTKQTLIHSSLRYYEGFICALDRKQNLLSAP